MNSFERSQNKRDNSKNIESEDWSGHQNEWYEIIPSRGMYYGCKSVDVIYECPM